ncbi:MAG: dockerin type I repeat-containing protein, partial [Muribaculaceae bacterium]|nr:dockerin type I repeat-containing protein [Muribaculaceae bacterium]
SGLIPVDLPESDSPYPGAADGCARAAECGNPRPKKTNVQFPASNDPNDLLGYVSEAGSHYIGKSIKTLGYSIEFENDKETATASALSVRINNKLDAKVFDLKSFRPKEVKIGKKSYVFNDFSNSLVATVDMRPEINGIAQINLDYNETSGDLNLLIETLNPYTMEVSKDVSQGILPVNYNGLGLGEMSYEINLRNGISHKTAIANQAEIVFDNNDPIVTPVWDNETDYISPVSEIINWESEDGYAYSFELDGADEDSGLWRFDLYMRTNEESEWTLVKEGIEDKHYVHTFKEKLSNPQFLSVAIDYAGNYEDTVINSKFMGDVDSNGRVDSNDLVLLYRYYVGQPVNINLNVADVNNDGKIDSQDAVAVQRIYLQQSLSKSVKRKLKNFRKRDE